ncbi:outer membrane beta-barrel family protein [Tenacibaculum agarivorans]|uniref:outer membrane beta-barrel family protein n=1 Tax=Tenacibaculum agarivorans TaxID=1908389 RepID=UPI0009FAC257|nr:outer membrane beta-barrel family protein [Tenacibaculum agarivorans]
MKNCYLFFFTLLLSIAGSYAQKGELSGKVIDQVSKKAVPYVSVVCKNNKKEIVSGGISNENGLFIIKKLPFQQLFVEIQSIGYRTIQKTIYLNKDNPKVDLGTLLLEESNNTLENVEIKGETASLVQKIDRKIINVGKDLSASGANALQLLQNLPTLDVDPVNGTVSLRGNDNVRILVDGKPSNLDNDQLLRQIRSNSIKQVEIITNPSAKYSPEGMSGLINLVLKKNAQIGFNGSISAGVEHSKNTRPDFYFESNYKTGKVNFYGNYSYNFGDYATIFSYDRTDIDLFQNLDFLNDSQGHNFRIGADITLYEQNILSIYTSQGFNPNSLRTQTTILENNIQTSNTTYFSDYNLRDETYNIGYLHNFDKKGQQLELELNYSIFEEPEVANNTDALDGSSILNFNSTIEHTRKLWLANIDYTKPIEKGNIEIGLEYRKRNVANNIITNQQIQITPPTIQPFGNTKLTYDRDIFSGYINFNKEFGKFSFQSGLRAEQLKLDAFFTNPTQGDSAIKQDVFSLYPSAFLLYQLTDDDSFQISYSRRVNRPSIYHVYSILEWYSPLTVSVGNPNLRQQFTNSVEFNYTKNFKKGFLSLGAFYRRSNDYIGALIQTDPVNPDRQLRTFINYDYADDFGMEMSAKYKAIQWWSISPSLETYIQQSQGFLNNRLENITNTNIKGRIRNSLRVSKKIKLQFDAIYRGRNATIQQTLEPYTYFNASARFSLFDGNGSLNIRGNDIFNNRDFNIISNNPFPQNVHYDLELDLIYVGFTYNFGSGKNRERERKYRDNNEKQKGLL